MLNCLYYILYEKYKTFTNPKNKIEHKYHVLHTRTNISEVICSPPIIHHGKVEIVLRVINWYIQEILTFSYIYKLHKLRYLFHNFTYLTHICYLLT